MKLWMVRIRFLFVGIPTPQSISDKRNEIAGSRSSCAFSLYLCQHEQPSKTDSAFMLKFYENS